MGDRVLVDRPLERGQVGDVALDPREPGERVVVEQQAQPMEVVGGVERDDRGALRDELRDGPCADAAVGARDEVAVHGAGS